MFESALAPILITEDANVLKQVATQINMDVASGAHAGIHGQRYIKEFDDSDGGDLGFASHSVNDHMKLMVKTCRYTNRTFSWKQICRDI